MRIIGLVNPDLVPPVSADGISDEEMADWKMEFDVCATLEEMGHEVFRLGLAEVSQLQEVQQDFEPHVVFNMMEEFHGSATYEPYIVGHMELLKLPYTGCNPQGLMLAHDKVICKQMMAAHGIPTPQSVVFPLRGAAPDWSHLTFPLLVKSSVEDASLGIELDSLVHDKKSLLDRVERVHEEQQSDALVEQFIDGREFYVGTLGNRRPAALPVWELLFRRLPTGVPNIATADVKWDFDLQKRIGVHTQHADIPDKLARHLQKLAKQVHQSLGLSGYARMDFRVTPDGQPYVLEANPNPNLSFGEDYAESAEVMGMNYPDLLQKILNLAVAYRPAWKI